MKTETDLSANAECFLVDHAEVCAWILSGKAKFGIASVNTSARFSFRTFRFEEENRWGVKGEHDDVYLGTLILSDHHGLQYYPWRKAPADDTRQTMMKYLTWVLREGIDVPSQMKIWRGNECGRCGKELVSEYAIIGYGPTCCGYLGINAKEVLKARTPEEQAEIVQRMLRVGGVQGAVWMKCVPREKQRKAL